VTFRDTDDVNHVVLMEDRVDRDWLLEKLGGKVDLVGDGTAVHLDLHEVSLLLTDAGLGDLGVSEHAHDGGVLLDASDATIDRRLVLGVVLGVAAEGLLL